MKGGKMEISKQGSEPIYLKIVDNFKMQILSGILKSNDKLPSVRELAMTLMVNPNTIQKAYSELEREGYIYVTIGKGNFVSENIETIKKNVIEDKMKALEKDIKVLLSYGAKKSDIINKIEGIGGNKN